MKKAKLPDATKEFEAELARLPDRERYVLKLYVIGMTARSAEAVAALTTLCQERLQGRYDLEVIDIHQRPELASKEQIVALPMLVKQLPAPMRRLIGNLADEERVLVGLNLQPKQT
jgi:circadian clock protein KaiB